MTIAHVLKSALLQLAIRKLSPHAAVGRHTCCRRVAHVPEKFELPMRAW
jgi:hypothetical protein